MGLELMDETERPHALVLEVFFSDADGAMTLTAYREAIPLELVEEVTSQARLWGGRMTNGEAEDLYAASRT